ncbi:hypothetical protein R1sor_004711 [Riccia sorocarpa]|uniref:TFIIS N-terminal domain-containing protein n=1 Tax=Riccia sorocarpa TaxID=122646 RepID=A0ABD3HL89_9MARC
MSRAEPKVKAMEEDINRHKEGKKKDIAEIKRLLGELEKANKTILDLEEKLRLKILEISKMKRCRLCLAGNMTPRSRETFIRKSLTKRYSQIPIPASLLGLDENEKTHVEVAKDDGEAGKKATDEVDKAPATEGPGASTGVVNVTSAEGDAGAAAPAPGRYKSSTVITFLRAALLKRSQRPSLEEAAKQTIAQDMAAIGLLPPPVDTADKEIQTEPVTIHGISDFASVLKRSASCPARLFWVEATATAEQRARHRSWMQEQGLVGAESENRNEDDSGEGDDDEVEIIIADKPIVEPAEGQEVAPAGDETGMKDKKSQKTMKKKLNKLANESLEALGSLGDEISQLSGGADIAFKMASIISRWKKVARATNLDADSEGAEGGGPREDGTGKESDDLDWEDEGEDGEDGDGRGRRRKRSKGIRKGSSGIMDEFGGKGRRSLERDSIGKFASKKSMKYSAQGFELGKLVPLGFASMMNINTPPKSVKYFNERQLTKLVTSIYVAKIDADKVDDASDNERQSSCEFVYDFMLNLYGLKRLAESAVWGLFKKIKQIIQQKKIDKEHKVQLLLLTMIIT